MHLYIISHYFIPFAGVGTRRIEYFVKHLLDKGYHITLFKADNKYYPEKTNAKIDHSNLTIINVTPSAINDRKWAKAYLTKICNTIDLKGKPDLVLFSCGPFFYLKLSTTIKRRYSIPYFIDFRDTYLNTKGFYERHTKFSIKRFVRFILLRLFDDNKSAILQADCITTVTETEKQILIRHYGESLTDKIKVVRNGFDDKLLSSIDQSKVLNNDPAEKYTIGVFGKFAYYSVHDAHALITAVIYLADKYPASIYLVGKKEDEFKHYTQKKYNNVSLVQTGFLSYSEGLQLLSGCRVLVLNNRSSNALGTKIFDYIALNKPIMAFTNPESEIANLLRPFENAFIVTNETECRQVIENILRKNIYYLDNDIDLFKYSRLSQTTIFEKLVDTFLPEN